MTSYPAYQRKCDDRSHCPHCQGHCVYRLKHIHQKQGLELQENNYTKYVTQTL